MYYRRKLKNGIRVIAEKIPHFRSVSIGFWIGAGSVYEHEHENGISHFIEHMMFKGTETKNAKEIAAVMDGVGGQLNAFTSKECTCYYVKIMDEYLEKAIELLSDMLLHSTFDEKEMEKEKGVVLEEINMVEDTPEELVHDLLSKVFFDRHPLSMPILGTEQNILSFSRKDIHSFLNRFYTPDNIVISVAGNFNEEQLDELIDKYLGNWFMGFENKNHVEKPIYKKNIVIREKATEQTHVCLGIPGIPQGDDSLYPLLILNNVFGGGMSSRLFQNIREERGLAYSVYSYPSSYCSAGIFTIYAGMKPSQAEEVVKLAVEEIINIKNNGITIDEFKQSKDQLKGNYILGLESTSSRMSALGKSELLLNKVFSPSEIIAKIDKVKIDDVVQIINQVFNLDCICAAVVGKIDPKFRLEQLIG